MPCLQNINGNPLWKFIHLMLLVCLGIKFLEFSDFFLFLNFFLGTFNVPTRKKANNANFSDDF